MHTSHYGGFLFLILFIYTNAASEKAEEPSILCCYGDMSSYGEEGEDIKKLTFHSLSNNFVDHHESDCLMSCSTSTTCNKTCSLYYTSGKSIQRNVCSNNEDCCMVYFKPTPQETTILHSKDCKIKHIKRDVTEHIHTLIDTPRDEITTKCCYKDYNILPVNNSTFKNDLKDNATDIYALFELSEYHEDDDTSSDDYNCPILCESSSRKLCHDNCRVYLQNNPTNPTMDMCKNEEGCCITLFVDEINHRMGEKIHIISKDNTRCNSNNDDIDIIVNSLLNVFYLDTHVEDYDMEDVGSEGLSTSLNSLLNTTTTLPTPTVEVKATTNKEDERPNTTEKQLITDSSSSSEILSTSLNSLFNTTTIPIALPVLSSPTPSVEIKTTTIEIVTKNVTNESPLNTKSMSPLSITLLTMITVSFILTLLCISHVINLKRMQLRNNYIVNLENEVNLERIQS